MTTVFEEGAPRESHPGPRAPEYVADPAEYIGLPAPDLSIVAAHQGDAELETRVRNTIYQCGQLLLSRRLAARQIIAIVRQANLRAYTDRLTLPAEHVEAGWQIVDAKDEETWHDVTEVVECNLGPACEVRRTLDAGDVCIVLVGSAWADGWAHYASSATVDVRIPAAGER